MLECIEFSMVPWVSARGRYRLSTEIKYCKWPFFRVDLIFAVNHQSAKIRSREDIFLPYIISNVLLIRCKNAKIWSTQILILAKTRKKGPREKRSLTVLECSFPSVLFYFCIPTSYKALAEVTIWHLSTLSVYLTLRHLRHPSFISRAILRYEVLPSNSWTSSVQADRSKHRNG